MSEKTDKRASDEELIKFALLAASCVIIAWVISWIWIDGTISARTDRGTFGDKFGAVNSLFSGLAFVGIIVTVLMQSKELRFQQKELEATREVLKSQIEESKKQNDTLIRQKFENTFFELLKLLNSIIEAMSLPASNVKDHQGRGVFKILYVEFCNSAKTVRSFEPVVSVYESFYNNRQSLLGHYFRLMYNIIKFIHRAEVEQEDKQFYVNLVRAQLSSYEFVLIFYNCLSVHGKTKFKPLIERYGLLEKMDDNLLIDKSHYNAYDPKAFGVGKQSG